MVAREPHWGFISGQPAAVFLVTETAKAANTKWHVNGGNLPHWALLVLKPNRRANLSVQLWRT